MERRGRPLIQCRSALAQAKAAQEPRKKPHRTRAGRQSWRSRALWPGFDPLAALAHGVCCLQPILRCAVVGADGLEPPTLSV